jgi:hypothetical protein
MTQKTTASNERIATRSDFIAALYPDVPDQLWLELRCIHPETGEVRLFWTQPGNDKQRDAVMKQTDKLNAEGYGVYFAPCLRREKKGGAASAALLPALWVDVDCDGDPIRRDKGLVKLREFEPVPSIIVDSGGGWHAYWLLEQPFLLEIDADKQKIAAILRGLFAALGGDPGYVKSVASVIRLPDSVNTKPERGGVGVAIIESDPERRYALNDFGWLESSINEERIGDMRVVTLNSNGYHPLPPRTEQYLASGAHNGSRNAELFAAACQLRDAGYSQGDAERELVARHVVDGDGSENPTSREKEARATIASAFRQPPRDPIAAPRQQARQRVDTLVNRYRRDAAEPERPTVEQVREAVEACTALDPLEWAEERKRLKAVCGDTFRVEDLNSMYKQARRELERSQQPELSNAPRYVETEGGMVFEKTTERGTTRQTVAEWYGRIVEWMTQVNDDGQSEHVMRLHLRHDAHTTTLDVPSELFGDPNALQRFIAQKAGAIYTACAGMHRHLPNAILKLSGSFPTRQTYRFMGWTQIEGKWVYVSPLMSIGAAGVLAEPHEVELESRLRDYHLTESSWTDSLSAFSVAVRVMPANLAPTLIAFTLLPLIQRFLPAATAKPAVHLSGTTGSGKSEIAAVMASFYGDFARDSPPAQWGDTVNTVEALGYSLADALYWVDDYKTIYADTRTFSRLMQSYSRTMGRGRLTREAKLRQDRPCRGHLLSTGETTLEGEASVLSRMLVLDIAPWKARDPGGLALKQAEALHQHLPGFTVQFIQWLARQADDKGFARRLADKLVTNTDAYETYLNTTLGSLAHTGRMERNWGLLLTVYQLLGDFLAERGAADVLPTWQDAILETVRLVQQERAGDAFIQALDQLLASGEADITASRHPVEPKPGVTIVGYEDEHFVYLLPEIAYREVMRIHPLKFSTAAIGSQLKEDGWLLPGSSDSHLTMQIRVRGRRVRVWRLKAELFRGENGDSGDATDGDAETTAERM